MRKSWVKMIYGPGDAEALGEFRESPTGKGWRFVHQTVSSQRYAKYNCPGGVDVGLIAYLRDIGFAGTYVLHYTDTNKTFEIPVEVLLRHLRSGIVAWTQTRKGQRRHRVFVVDADWATPKWAAAEYLAGGRIQRGDTVYLDKDGKVVPKDAVLSDVA